MTEVKNEICRRCKYLETKDVKGSIFPIYFCKEYPNGLDADYMNVSHKKCFSKKVTGPWRMPEGTFDDEEFRKRIVLKSDEYYKGEELSLTDLLNMQSKGLL